MEAEKIKAYKFIIKQNKENISKSFEAISEIAGENVCNFEQALTYIETEIEVYYNTIYFCEKQIELLTK